MEAPTHHILVCCSFRASGDPQGICHKKGSLNFLAYIENELIDRGLDNVQVSSTGCLKVCDRGPAMVVYPENIWYGGVETEEDIDAILDALEDGEIATDYVIS
jgi:(2Fe-2S) ferredoxin